MASMAKKIVFEHVRGADSSRNPEEWNRTFTSVFGIIVEAEMKKEIAAMEIIRGGRD